MTAPLQVNSNTFLKDSLLEMEVAGGNDVATFVPPSGPKSIIQSEFRMTSRLCSITATVLPASTSFLKTTKSFQICKMKTGGWFV